MRCFRSNIEEHMRSKESPSFRHSSRCFMSPKRHSCTMCAHAQWSLRGADLGHHLHPRHKPRHAKTKTKERKHTCGLAVCQLWRLAVSSKRHATAQKHCAWVVSMGLRTDIAAQMLRQGPGLVRKAARQPLGESKAPTHPANNLLKEL